MTETAPDLYAHLMRELSRYAAGASDGDQITTDLQDNTAQAINVIEGILMRLLRDVHAIREQVEALTNRERDDQLSDELDAAILFSNEGEAIDTEDWYG